MFTFLLTFALVLDQVVGEPNSRFLKPSISASQWAQLSNSLDGRVILPTDSDYVDEYNLWTANWDDVYPEAVIELGTEQDAVTVQKFLLANPEATADISLRNCKHSLSGVSTTSGIVISTGSLQTLEASSDGTHAAVGPGVNLSTFTAWAEENGVTLPHGDCSSVCFGGFLLV